jgi:hypothetical protein
MQPSDKVSAQLLRMLEQAPAGAVAAPGQAPAPAPALNAAQSPAAPDITGALTPTTAVREGNLEGNWTASPAPETTITLGLTDAGHFTWKVTHQGKTQEFQGDRTYGNGILTLAQAAQAGQTPLVGRVQWTDDNHFIFKVMAGPPDDPGLAFTRTP